MLVETLVAEARTEHSSERTQTLLHYRHFFCRKRSLGGASRGSSGCIGNSQSATATADQQEQARRLGGSALAIASRSHETKAELRAASASAQEGHGQLSGKSQAERSVLERMERRGGTAETADIGAGGVAGAVQGVEPWVCALDGRQLSALMGILIENYSRMIEYVSCEYFSICAWCWGCLGLFGS